MERSAMPPRTRFASIDDEDEDLADELDDELVDPDDALFDDDDEEEGSDMDLASLTPEPVTRRNPSAPSRSITSTTGPRNARPVVSLPGRAPRRSSSRHSDLSLIETVEARRAQAGSSTAGPTWMTEAQRPPGGRAGTSMAAAIDLTGDDSDDDEPVIIGQAGPGPRTRIQARVPRNAVSERRPAAGDGPVMIAQREFAEEMLNINRALERRREETTALIAADQQDDRRRLVLSPPAPAADFRPARASPLRQAARPGAFGGAVLRRGDQQINYEAGGARRRRVIQPIDDDLRIGRDLVQEGLPGPARRQGLGARLRDLRRQQDDLMLDLGVDRQGRGLDEADGLWDDDSDDEDFDPDNEDMDDVMNDPLLWVPPVRPRLPGPGAAPAAAAAAAQGNGGLARMLGAGWRGLFGRFAEGGDQHHLLQHLIAPPGLEAGPAALGGRGPGGIAAILDRVIPFHFTPAQAGFTTDFEDPSEKEPILLDDDGKVVKQSSKLKPYLSCVMCHDPLLNSSYYRSNDDRVWALRCGHLIDQKCLLKLSTPVPLSEPEEPVLKRKKTRRKATKKYQLVEHEYACPVDGCEGKGVSVLEDEKWEQKMGEGAIGAFV